MRLVSASTKEREISAANVILFDVTLIHSPVYRIFRFPNTYTLIHVAATFDKASSVAIEMAIKAQRAVSN